MYNGNVAWTLNYLSIINWRKGHIEQAIEKNRQAYNIYNQLYANKQSAYNEAMTWTNMISDLLTEKNAEISLCKCLEYSLSIYISDLQRRTRRHLL